jgi:hypothetical protein
MNKRFQHIIPAVIGFVFCSLALEAGPFYVVIGTFSEQGSARRFATSVVNVFPSASFKFDSGRNLYHVHVLETSRHNEAENIRHHLQVESGFADAWIFTDFTSGDTSDGMVQSPEDYKKLELFTGGAVMLGTGDKGNFSVRNNTDIRNAAHEGVAKAFTFSAVTPGGKTVNGKVSLMSNGKPLSSFPTGEVVAFGGKDENHILAFVCEVPGFTTETKFIDLANPPNSRGITTNTDGVWQVQFPIRKLVVNKVTLFYRDMFFSDAAIFQAASKTRMEMLRSLLQSNPRWRIVVNSHCNAGFKRDLMVPGREGNYFEVSQGVTRSGTDKQLTAIRARAIRDYLVGEGIDSKRIHEMGWGSVDLIVASTTVDAPLNERVEVELVAE